MSKGTRKATRWSDWLPWLGGAVLIAAIGFAWVVGGAGGVGEHPEPRANAESLETEEPSRYAGYGRVSRVYAMVEAAKPTLDGLYCYCRCREHSDHYSLLTCFQTDHGAGCDICLGQAMLAYEMAQRGASLDEIRQETDRRYARGGGGGGGG